MGFPIHLEVGHKSTISFPPHGNESHHLF